MLKAPRRQILSLAAGALGALASGSTAFAAKSIKTPVPNWIPSKGFLNTVPMLMRCASVPGLSMAVIDPGKASWTRNIGALNADTKAPVRDDTLFEAASMSKPVFAYAVLKLAESQRIDLDKPLTEYYMPTYLPDHPYIRKITARHVLTHTTGFPDWGTTPASLVPAFEPGKYFSYSGEGFFLLQLIVEKITGLSLQAFMRSMVFVPAGMATSSYAMGTDNVGKVAFGHTAGRVASQGRRDTVERIKAVEAKWGKPSSDWLQDDWLRALAETDTKPQKRNRVGHVNAAASLLTTAPEYAIFLRLLMDRTPFATWKISEPMRRAMLSPQIAVQKDVPFWWGLGVAIERDGANWRVGHEGNNDNNFLAYSGLDPASGRGLVILTNGGGGFGVYQRIVRAVTGLDQLSFIATYHPRHDA